MGEESLNLFQQTLVEECPTVAVIGLALSLRHLYEKSNPQTWPRYHVLYAIMLYLDPALQCLDVEGMTWELNVLATTRFGPL